MDNPTITEGIGLIKFNFEDLSIRIEASDYSADGHAELSFYALDPEGDRLLLITRVNLLSTSTMNSLVKRLERNSEKLPWGDALTSVTRDTLKRARFGQPAIKVSEIADRVTPRYRLEPVIFEGEANLFYGDGDTGKSTVASLVSVLVQDNISALGFVPLAGNVLYLDYETSEETFKENILAIRKGLNIKPPQNEEDDILYRFCARPLSDDITEINKFVLENGIVLVVVDSMGMACGGDIEKLEFIRKYFISLRSLKITSLSIHHLTKQSDGSKPYGSVYAFNIPRSEFLLRHEQQPGESELYIGLYHKKCNIAKKIKPIGIRVDFSGEGEFTDTITFSNTNLVNIPTLAIGLPIHSRLVASLKRGQQSIPELAEELGESQNSIRRVLDRYKGKTFVKIGQKWGLLENETLL